MIRHLEPEPSPPQRVVVLGASGFVGRDLTEHLLALGIETRGLSSRDVDLTAPRSVEQLRETLGKGDVLVIASAITPDKGRDIRTLMSNLEMGEHLSAFLQDASCAHVLYVSSDAVYADDANPVRESSCSDPSTFHGLMHLVRERMLASVLQKQKTPFLILRPSAMYGAGDTHNSYGPNRFLRSARKEHKIKLFGNGEEKRDHVYIKDLSRIASLSLAHRSEGVLNVATGNSISFFDLAEMIGALGRAPVEIEGSPRANPITHRHFDIALTIKMFPSFRYTPLQAGLAETLNRTANGSID